MFKIIVSVIIAELILDFLYKLFSYLEKKFLNRNLYKIINNLGIKEKPTEIDKNDIMRDFWED